MAQPDSVGVAPTLTAARCLADAPLLLLGPGAPTALRDALEEVCEGVCGLWLAPSLLPQPSFHAALVKEKGGGCHVAAAVDMVNQRKFSGPSACRRMVALRMLSHSVTLLQVCAQSQVFVDPRGAQRKAEAVVAARRLQPLSTGYEGCGGPGDQAMGALEAPASDEPWSQGDSSSAGGSGAQELVVVVPAAVAALQAAASVAAAAAGKAERRAARLARRAAARQGQQGQQQQA
jgi:hypothetical protein